LRLVVTGGGTGGHVYPAIAVAEYIKESDPASTVTFVGSAGGPEADAARAAGIPFEGLTVAGLIGKSPLKAIKALLMFARSTMRCRRLFKKLEPDRVLGTGGYAAATACLTALWSRVPLLLLEMNYEPGWVTRLFARRARTVAVAHQGTAARLSPRANVVVTGVPVRAEIEALAGEEARRAAADEAIETFGLEKGRRTLLVFGGSQGAQAINEALWAALPALAGRADLQVLHMTGKNNFDVPERSGAEAAAAAGRLLYAALPYSERMDLAFAVADLAISRAGAGTVAELTAAMLPSVLVPYPHATGGHQEKNARALAETGAVVVIPQTGGSASDAVSFAIGLMDDRGELAAMKEAARSARGAGGTKGIARLLEELTLDGR
jgi:UDP-N-acetylglucosamine--N-acetylmuramyl-(pentapeptide) pyrophosphoryl-undecaprenol N-acetylglucosamine transferase